MLDTLLFEIPVYRCSSKQKSEEDKRELEKLTLEFGGAGARSKEEFLSAKSRAEMYVSSKRWRPYNYNDVVGWIRLYIYGTQLRYDLYWVNKKRISKRMKNPTFFVVRHMMTIPVGHSRDSTEIFSRLMSWIEAASKKGILKKRFVDTAALRAIGPNLNWSRLFSSNQL